MTKHHESGLEHEINELKENLIELKDGFIEQAADIAAAAHKSEDKLIEAIEAHPLTTLGLAAAIGFIFGFLVTRK